MLMHHEALRKDYLVAYRTGAFFKDLSTSALRNFESLAAVESYPSDEVLFEEKQLPSNIFVLLEGRVKLRMDSTDGKRLTLRIAEPGEFLGLTSALSCSPYELTAETQCMCKVASIRCQDFRGLLMRYPAAFGSVIQDLSEDYHRACERLRTVGLASTVPIKLARLLLECCAGGKTTMSGARVRLPLTHGEIGEFIGASRETISRTLKKLRNRQLVDQKGPTLMVPNRLRLECYAQMQAGMSELAPSEWQPPSPPLFMNEERSNFLLQVDVKGAALLRRPSQ